MTEPATAHQLAPAAKSDKRKQTIIVVATVAGVLLTYLIYRRSKNTAATGSATTVATPVAAATDTTADDNTQSALTSVANQLGNLTSLLTPTTTATSTAPIASTLYNPSTDANQVSGYVQNKYGTILQVLSDGSLFGLTGQQYAALGNPAYTPDPSLGHSGDNGIVSYSTASNIAKSPVNQAVTPVGANQTVA